MATRPTIPVVVRASDSTYSGIGNDLDTTPTKIARSGAELALGYVPDSPLGSRPVSAQGVNYEQNRNDQWVEWTSLGSSSDGADTHIVETDSGGDINVVGANCINVRVNPNSGEDGIEVTLTGGSKGLEITQDATSSDYGILVDSADGASFPCMFIDTESAPGIVVSTGSSAGISIAATANGGTIGPSIDMQANILDSNNLGVGTFWNREQNSIENLKVGMGSSAGYILVSKKAPCYARSNSIAFALDGNQVDQAIGGTFTFKTDQLPQNASDVLVTIWGRVTLSAFQDNTVALRVRDRTVGGDPAICEMFIYSQEHSTATLTTIRQSATIAQTYSLPSSGGRTFDLVWTGSTTGIPGSFNGFVEITELRG